MKTRAFVASAIVALFIISAVAVASAHSAAIFSSGSFRNPLDGGSNEDGNQNQTTTHQLTTQDDGNNVTTTMLTTQGDDEGEDNGGQLSSPVLGETVTIPNLTGNFVTFGDNPLSGPATGSLNAKVTNILSTGIVLTITSGHLSFSSANLTITGGTIVLDSEGSGVGSGTAGSSSFIIHVDNFHISSTPGGAIKLDIKLGTSEFLVSLGSQTSSDGSGDSSGDSSGD